MNSRKHDTAREDPLRLNLASTFVGFSCFFHCLGKQKYVVSNRMVNNNSFYAKIKQLLK